MCCDASIVVTVFNSCPLCFLFNSLCCDASILVIFNSCPFCILFFYLWLRVASGPRVKLASCKSDLTPPPPPPPVISTDRSKAVAPVLVLLFVALWFILRGDLLYVFPCVTLFLCFSVLLVLRLPRLGKRELFLFSLSLKPSLWYYVISCYCKVVLISFCYNDWLSFCSYIVLSTVNK